MRKKKTLKGLERRDWELWVLAIGMLLVFTFFLVIIYFYWEPSEINLSEYTIDILLLGFIALSLLFCAYVIFTRRTLKKLQKSFIAEQLAAAKSIEETVESMIDCVILIDLKGRITQVNKVVETTYGYKKDEIIGKTPWEFLIKEDISRFREKLKETIEKGSIREFECTVATKDDREILTSFSSTMLKDVEGKPKSIVTVLRDITERKQAEEALKKSEEKIKERTKQLEKAHKDLLIEHEKLEQINKMKSDFISYTSHQLRTPLAAVRGYADIILSARLGKVTAEQKQRLAKIISHADRLTHLVNDLLDLSKLEAGEIPLKIKLISVQAAIEEALLEVEMLASEKKVTIEAKSVPANLKVLADEQGLHNVLQNLLDNAIKFNSIGGKITIKATELKSKVRIDITDTGMGIPEKRLKKLFEPFSQMGTSGSSGLGLAIVNNFTEAMSGTISVKSKEKEGSTFSVTLPQGRQ